MRYDAAAFLESLFHEPAGFTVGTDTALSGFSITPADLPADWHFLWDERAAIMEYDGKMSREQAEAAALADTLRRMRAAGIEPNRN
jgi:hypothetical protein